MKIQRKALLQAMRGIFEVHILKAAAIHKLGCQNIL